MMSRLAKPAQFNDYPTTPTGRKGKDLNDVIITVAQEFNFPIRPRQFIISPSRRAPSLTDKCISSIEYLFWRDTNGLHNVQDTFRSDMREGSVNGDPFEVFMDRLIDAVRLVKNQPSTKILFQSSTSEQSTEPADTVATP